MIRIDRGVIFSGLILIIIVATVRSFPSSFTCEHWTHVKELRFEMPYEMWLNQFRRPEQSEKIPAEPPASEPLSDSTPKMVICALRVPIIDSYVHGDFGNQAPPTQLICPIGFTLRESVCKETTGS